MELFDTTELRQIATLARYVETAAASGQADLFAETTGEPTAETTVDAVEAAFAWPAPVGALLTREDAAGEMILS